METLERVRKFYSSFVWVLSDAIQYSIYDQITKCSPSNNFDGLPRKKRMIGGIVLGKVVSTIITYPFSLINVSAKDLLFSRFTRKALTQGTLKPTATSSQVSSTKIKNEPSIKILKTLSKSIFNDFFFRFLPSLLLILMLFGFKVFFNYTIKCFSKKQILPI